MISQKALNVNLKSMSGTQKTLEQTRAFDYGCTLKITGAAPCRVLAGAKEMRCREESHCQTSTPGLVRVERGS